MASAVSARVSEDEWAWNDPQIPDDEVIFRRVRMNPDHRTFDPEKGQWVPSAGAFRRMEGEGMSAHMNSVLESKGRAGHSLYDPERYGAVRFPVEVVRSAGAGVVQTLPSVEEEPDQDLREAHVEARPPTWALDKRFWSKVRAQMIKASVWVEQRAS